MILMDIMTINNIRMFDKYYLHNFKCFMKNNGSVIYIFNKTKKSKKEGS